MPAAMRSPPTKVQCSIPNCVQIVPSTIRRSHARAATAKSLHQKSSARSLIVVQIVPSTIRRSHARAANAKSLHQKSSARSLIVVQIVPSTIRRSHARVASAEEQKNQVNTTIITTTTTRQHHWLYNAILQYCPTQCLPTFKTNISNCHNMYIYC
ncbi:hypothetical protein JTE90_003895 [Oedothorax gibbosus]|uniref:Uncharacterized protein n=1 Tax=Oedothorax gibbosus TaxID=931172 RepID=A0AAV6UIC8_9ARAC|nr:hypothetical protein JTE90_003895 [Oedothorax gibbosus]